MTTQPVPVSGEEQPDPRAVALVVDFKLGEMMLSEDQALAILNRIDLADRAAGIRRVTEDALVESAAEWAHHQATGVYGGRWRELPEARKQRERAKVQPLIRGALGGES